MDFATAIQEVIAITKRQDKEAEIALNINKAISFFTMKAEFAQDLLETELAIDSSSYGEVLDIASLVRFRKVKYLKPRGKRYYIKPIDPTQILTPNGVLQPNRYYIAGTNLTFTLSELNTFLDIGYYQYPTLLEVGTTEEHWMLTMVPWMVIERAAASIFSLAGDDASARTYNNSSMEMFVTARNDFADAVMPQAE